VKDKEKDKTGGIVLDLRKQGASEEGTESCWKTR